MPYRARRVGIVGATGYISRALVADLLASGDIEPTLFGRRGGQVLGLPVQPLSNSASPFAGLDCVVHLAAIAHPRASRTELQTVNVDLAVSVAERALTAGVRRFVFMSSLVVHGRQSSVPITPDSALVPTDAYGRSKAAAEGALSRLVHGTGMTLVILRPPMIYGPDPKGSFAHLAQLVATGLPLPLAGAIRPRTLCTLDNAVSAIRLAIEAETPPRVLLPGDPQDLSTADLVRSITTLGERKARLWYAPTALLGGLLKTVGRSQMADSLFGPLAIDRRHWMDANWSPPRSSEDGLRQALRIKPARPTILFLTNLTPYFFSHRLDLARGARASGFEIALAASDIDGFQSRLDAEQITPVRLPHIVRGLNPLADLRASLGLASALRRTCPTNLHCSGLKTIFLCAIAGWMTPLPRVVCIVTGLGTIYVNDTPVTRVLRIGVESVLRTLLRRSNTRTIFQNQDDLDHFVRAGIVSSDRASLIRGSGVDTDHYAFTPEPQATCSLVVFPARLLRSKGVIEFVEAARILRARGVEARFALVGDLDPQNPDSLTQGDLDDLKVAADVEVWGYRQDMRAVFEQSHLVCLPSYREGVPKALIEAASVGRAIVTTDVPGCREIVVDGLNGLLVPARDAGALADAIDTLLADRDERARMGQAARHRVEADFSAAVVNRATLALYKTH